MTYDKDIQKAVDDYIEMERKAKAWDELYALQQYWDKQQEKVLMDTLLENAK